MVIHDGSNLGILPVQTALGIAKAKGLDLVEVSPDARPPVCRIMDYGKFKYEKSKKKTPRFRKHINIGLRYSCPEILFLTCFSVRCMNDYS